MKIAKKDLVVLPDGSVGEAIEVFVANDSRVYKIKRSRSDEILYFDETKVQLKRHIRNFLIDIFRLQSWVLSNNYSSITPILYRTPVKIFYIPDIPYKWYRSKVSLTRFHNFGNNRSWSCAKKERWQWITWAKIKLLINYFSQSLPSFMLLE